MSGPPSNPKMHRSAFDRGKDAGAGASDEDGIGANPFPAGSADHRNFDLGWRIGRDGAQERARYIATTPDANRPDHDEIDD